MIDYDQENGHLRPTFDLFECIRARRDNRDFMFYYETNDGHMYHCTITRIGIEPAYLMSPSPSPHYVLLAHNIVLKSIDFSIEDISFHYEMNVSCRTTNDTFVSEYVLPYFIELTNCVLNKTNGFSNILSADDDIINFIKSVINAFQDDVVKELFDEFVVRVWLNPNIFVVTDIIATDISFLLIKELHYAHKDYLFKYLTIEQRNVMLSRCDKEREYELKAELVHYSNPVNPSDDKDRWTL